MKLLVLFFSLTCALSVRAGTLVSDVGVELTPLSQATPGAVLQFQMRAFNSDTASAPNALVTLNFSANILLSAPPNCQFTGQVMTCAVGDPDLAGGEERLQTFELLLDPASRAPATVQAEVSFDGADNNPLDNLSEFTLQAVPVVDLQLRMQADSDVPVQVPPGEIQLFELVVTNHGPSDALNPRVQWLPSGDPGVVVALDPAAVNLFDCDAATLRCDLGAFPSGQQTVIGALLTVNDGSGAVHTVTAQVRTVDDADPDLDNNADFIQVLAQVAGGGEAVVVPVNGLWMLGLMAALLWLFSARCLGALGSRDAA